MRKLANASLAFAAAIFAANYIMPVRWIAFSAVISAILAATLSLANKKRLRPLIAALIFVSIGFAEYQVYAERTVTAAKEYAGKTEHISAELIDYPEIYDEYCRVEVRVTTDGMPHFKTLLYDNEKLLSDAEPGQIIELDAKLSAADTLYGESYDLYNSKGIYLKATAKGDIKLRDSFFDIRTVPVRLSRLLSDRVDLIFPKDTAVFMKSLMLGDKHEFYDDNALYLSMSRAGLMHVVAVSGMHVAFLVSLLMFIFGAGSRGALFSTALVWLFVLVTGAGPAAVRAGFMQTVLLLAPVLKRENDPITSLSFVLAIILFLNPFAATSVSLQLSFGAMAGIVCFGEKINNAIIAWLPEKMRKKPVMSIAATVSSSLAVLIFTVPVSAVHFGTVPLLSVFTNIAALWSVSLCFCGGWISCALSVVPAVGKASAFLCSFFARYIILVAKLISSVPLATLYLKTEGAAFWIILSYVLFAAAWHFKKKSVFRLILPAAISLLFLVFIIERSDKLYRENDTIAVIDVGQGQCVAAFSGDSTVLVDCGNIYCLDDAGMTAGEYLISCGRDRVDLLLLTHLHEDHADGVPMLMEMLPIGTIIIPSDSDENEDLYRQIVQSAEAHGTELVSVDRSASAECGDIEIEIIKPEGHHSGNEKCLMAIVGTGGFKTLITSDADSDTERELVSKYDLSDIDVIVAGHHGSKYSCSPELLREAGGKLAVISVGNNYYGHPADETLERLETYGYNVLRTDKDHTIEIRTGNQNG